MRIRDSIEIDVLRSPGGAAGADADIDRLQAMIQEAVVRGDMAAAQVAALQLAGFDSESVDAIAEAIRPSG